MKVVFSGPTSDGNFLQGKQVKNTLFTFADKHVEKCIDSKWLKYPLCKEMNIWMDSGAFTVWNTGGDFTVEDHIKRVEQFWKKYKGCFKNIYFISLDVIPGKPGVIPNQKQIDDSAQQTFQNYLVSKKSGVIPEHLWLVTLHQHEDPNLILEYQKHNNYLCISPANDQSNDGRSKWLDQVFAIIDPKIKTHGLAVTGEFMVERYPWYSVDSISWKLPRMYGQTFYKTFWSKKTANKIFSTSSLEDIKKFDFKELLINNYTDKEKLNFQIDYFLDLEHDITNLWKKRGVEWN